MVTMSMDIASGNGYFIIVMGLSKSSEHLPSYLTEGSLASIAGRRAVELLTNKDEHLLPIYSSS